MNARGDAGMPHNPERRSFLSGASLVAMLGGLAAGYGTLAALAGRYLYPAEPEKKGWMYVTRVKAMKVGDSMSYLTPVGAKVTVARQARNGDLDDFVALSSTCPHLGCQVHWESHNERFFCPCHNGVFDPSGKGIGGPPGEAGQSLPRFPLKVEKGLLYIQVPITGLNVAEAGSTKSPMTIEGHDPCLRPREDRA